MQSNHSTLATLGLGASSTSDLFSSSASAGFWTDSAPESTESGEEPRSSRFGDNWKKEEQKEKEEEEEEKDEEVKEE